MQGTQFSRLLSVPVQIWGKLGIVLYFPVLQHCLQRLQGFTNTFLGAIFGKRFNSTSFINNLMMQYIFKELSKPKEKFWENLPRHLILYRNKNLQINQSSLIIYFFGKRYTLPKMSNFTILFQWFYCCQINGFSNDANYAFQ